MPTFSLRTQSLAERLQVLALRLQALGREAAMQGRALTDAKPLRALSTRARWRILGAAAVGVVLLTIYVLTLQDAVERGEALREQRRQQGITTFGAGTPPTGLQTKSPRGTRS